MNYKSMDTNNINPNNINFYVECVLEGCHKTKGNKMAKKVKSVYVNNEVIFPEPDIMIVKREYIYKNDDEDCDRQKTKLGISKIGWELVRSKRTTEFFDGGHIWHITDLYVKKGSFNYK